MASELRVNTITSTTGVGTVTLGSGGVSFSGTPRFNDVTLSSINGNPISGPRNKFINGNFDIWQRGSSLAGQGGNGLVYLADRWAIETWSSTTARLTYDRALDAPTVGGTVGFSSYSARITVTTTSNNSNTSDFGLLRQFIEGYNAQDLYQRPFTVSFWVKSSLVGTYCFSAFGGGVGPGQSSGTPSFSQTYTINNANTWEYKIIQVPACPAGTYSNWDFGNGRGFDIMWRLWSGNTSYSGSFGTWSTGAYTLPGSHINFAGTNGATWQIAQVQLEVGTVATPFERRSYGQELQLCERYYQVIKVYGNAYAGQYTNGGSFFGQSVSLHTKMRADASVATYEGISGTAYWTEPGQTAFSAASTTGITVTGQSDTVSMVQTRQAGNSTPTRNFYYMWEQTFNFRLAAEL